ncbi:MAG: hypothetical protein ABI744_02130 [Chloroflexota bacterium]
MSRSHGARFVTGLMLGTLLLGAAVAPVAAASHTRWVDNNTSHAGPSACANAHFSTIQAAIGASNPGDKVYVCPGNYQEEITINVRNLEVRSIPALGAKIWAPATMTDLGFVNALVNITARDVLFVGFWLKFHDGGVAPFVHQPITPDCQMVTAAIWAQAPHATIKANHIKTVGNNTLSGPCGYLFGIVLADLGPSSGGAWGPDASLVWRNWVRDFKEGGILTGGDRAVKVWNNNVRYVHYNDPATCNFVPVLGIKPSLEGNPGDVFPCEQPPTAQNTTPLDGLFPYSIGIADEGALVDIRGNTVFSTLDTATVGNQYSFLFGGIFLTGATAGSRVRSNIIDNVFAGMSVSDNGLLLPGIEPVPSAPDGVAVSGNRVSEGFFSILVDSSDGYYYANRAHLNFLGVIVGPDSANNTFERNDFRYNVEIDCADESIGTGTAGTANDWGDPLTNLGFNDDPDGICVPYFQIVL